MRLQFIIGSNKSYDCFHFGIGESAVDGGQPRSFYEKVFLTDWRIDVKRDPFYVTKIVIYPWSQLQTVPL